MTLEIKNRYGLPCSLKVFTINGQKANEDDFGSGYDDNSVEDYEEIPYGCGNRVWERIEDEKQIKKTTDKYHITKEEFNEICSELEAVLSVGPCSWCV